MADSSILRRRTVTQPPASTPTTSTTVPSSPTTATTTATKLHPLPGSGTTNVVSPLSGLNQKTSGASTSATPATTSYDVNEFNGTVAATFVASKGPELLNFARRKVEERGIRTKIIQDDDGDYNILLMSLPYSRMVTVAEELGLRKRDIDGCIRTFRVEDVKMYTKASSDTANAEPECDAIFSQSEQLLLLEYSLNAIKPDKLSFDDVVGNESILEWCKRQHYVDDVFPLHHRPAAAAILTEVSWKSPMFDVGGISKIKDYFGEKVALYFAFLGYYTNALMIYGAAGIVVFLLSMLFKKREPLLLFVFSIFATLWGAAFVSLWKRNNTAIVFMWTSLIMGDSADESLMSMTKKEDLRRKFFGIEVSHHITGEKITVFPFRDQVIRYALSVVVVLASLFMSSHLMLSTLDFEDIMHTWIRDKAPNYKWASSYFVREIVLRNLPVAAYLACLSILDTLYNTIARWLTENENHKYNADFENSLVFKLVLFQFLNMNMAYLHVAFIRRDYFRLASSIRTVLSVELFIGTIKKTVIPMFLSRRKLKARLADAVEKKRRMFPDLEEEEYQVQVHELNPITLQLDMDKYDGVFEDYFELVRQFSQITLFAAAFPLGAVLALLSNLIEIYADAYKKVNMTRRASPQRALNIGAWIRAFEFISIVAIMTNLGIITVTARFADSVVGKGVSKTEEYFWMVVIEHVLVVARFAFVTLFEGIPTWVRDQRAKERFNASKKPTVPTSRPGMANNLNADSNNIGTTQSSVSIVSTAPPATS